MDERLLKEGHNCWKISNAEKLALLYDGANYFDALFNTLPKAKSSIQIFGWEVDARLGLHTINPDYPKNLRIYLLGVASSKNVSISVSSWKPALYLKFDRELFAPFKWWKKSNSKVHYRQVRTPTTFSSYHEKVCIIDKQLCFLGGIDITKRRWDTQLHRVEDAKRIDGKGVKYNPVHDVQLAISGKVVKQVSEALADRFHPRDKNLNEEHSTNWPSEHPPQLRDVNVAISRTDPTRNVFEIEKFYLDAIRSSKKYIFIENQYLSHAEVIRSLCEKLNEVNGPEIVIIVPRSYPGFFERAIFSNERRKAIKRLKASDKYDRLLILYPKTETNKLDKFIVVHSKLMAVDGKLFTVGSANLNHRSLKVDNEMNICLEAATPEEETFINDAPITLLAEHLDISKEVFTSSWRLNNSLKASILEHSHKKDKTLAAVPLYEVPLKEKVFLWLLPFVDIKFRWPKSYFNLTLLLGLTTLLFAAKALYER
ncbi:MAG: hypothetical protein CME64_13880 [Halobacteriovoraceae bacterium]|nr:hypothetical protein [Halobacteriovoraceae bacterium]|tara:strand:+ start:15717 stop:17165 length:1449 start_codon:yes stop_codon:yes gene_type:complete